MEYAFFKLNFLSGVHFGNGMLNDSENIFRSDSLFSAIYIEALKSGVQDIFYDYVRNGDLIFSDVMPYIGDNYMLPKPIVYIDGRGEKGNSEEKKKIKKLKYIFAEDLNEYKSGNVDIEKYDGISFGGNFRQTKAAVEGLEDTLPYHVGVYYFDEGCGLYIISGYKSQEAYDLMCELLEMLSYTGIGGKKSSGLGRFEVSYGKKNSDLTAKLEAESNRYMLISTALPNEEDMAKALEDSSYLLLKRSGFVYSETFSEVGMRKEDMFMFAAGSTFKNKYSGDIFNVGKGGSHPVYRCGKAMFLGL